MTSPIRAALLLASTAALFVSSYGPLRAQDDVPWIWVGTVQLKDTRTVDGGPTGSASHELTAQLQLREAGRIPVFDTSGGRSRQVGEFVRLVDSGSRGARVQHQGSWVWDQGTTSNKYFFSGASEPALTDVHGWIYYSATDDDPVRAVLPHGAYAFWASAVSTNLEVKHDWVNVTTRGTFSGSRTSEVQDFPLTLWTGGARFWSESPDGIPASLDAATVIATAAATRARADLPGYEERAFAIRDDGMMNEVLFDRPLMAPQQGVESARWQLRRTRDIRATVTRVDKSWRPKRHEPVSVTARLDPALGLKGRFRFTLLDVSRHPGYATNMGGDDASLDMKFADAQAGFEPADPEGEGWVIQTSASDLTEAVVQIEPLDYGASAKLRAEVQIDGVWHECLTEAKENAIQLPWDLDGNSIADGYDTLWGTTGQAANADADAHPAGANIGDGFTNFEEYRGFVMTGVWEATVPGIKDLFISDEFGFGATLFQTTGLALRFIMMDEFNPSTRVVNESRSAHAKDLQYALRLQHGDAREPGELGYAVEGVPKEVTILAVDEFSHETLPDWDAALQDTIAHELGHAVDVHHHGPREVDTCGRNSGLIAPWRGTHSGDLACPMRYKTATFYKDRTGACHVWTEPWTASTKFCVSNQGTGYNAANATTGNAQVGNCMGQIRLVRP